MLVVVVVGVAVGTIPPHRPRHRRLHRSNEPIFGQMGIGGSPLSGSAQPHLSPEEKRMMLLTQDGRRFPMLKAKVTLGRATTNDVLIPDGWVSGYHALIWWDGRYFYLYDVDSRAGTYLNGTRLPARYSHPLRVGDQIYLGRYRLWVQAGSHAPQIDWKALWDEPRTRWLILDVLPAILLLVATVQTFLFPAQALGGGGLRVILGVVTPLVLIRALYNGRPWLQG